MSAAFSLLGLVLLLLGSILVLAHALPPEDAGRVRDGLAALMLRRAFCRTVHRGQFLDLAAVGGYRCSACGAGFVDLEDAGLLLLARWERQTTLSYQLQLERRQLAVEPTAHPFYAGTFRLLTRSGRVIRHGRIGEGAAAAQRIRA